MSVRVRQHLLGCVSACVYARRRARVCLSAWLCVGARPCTHVCQRLRSSACLRVCLSACTCMRPSACACVCVSACVLCAHQHACVSLSACVSRHGYVSAPVSVRVCLTGALPPCAPRRLQLAAQLRGRPDGDERERGPAGGGRPQPAGLRPHDLRTHHGLDQLHEALQPPLSLRQRRQGESARPLPAVNQPHPTAPPCPNAGGMCIISHLGVLSTLGSRHSPLVKPHMGVEDIS